MCIFSKSKHPSLIVVQWKASNKCCQFQVNNIPSTPCPWGHPSHQWRSVLSRGRGIPQWCHHRLLSEVRLWCHVLVFKSIVKEHIILYFDCFVLFVTITWRETHASEHLNCKVLIICKWLCENFTMTGNFYKFN